MTSQAGRAAQQGMQPLQEEGDEHEPSPKPPLQPQLPAGKKPDKAFIRRSKTNIDDSDRGPPTMVEKVLGMLKEKQISAVIATPNGCVDAKDRGGTQWLKDLTSDDTLIVLVDQETIASQLVLQSACNLARDFVRRKEVPRMLALLLRKEDGTVVVEGQSKLEAGMRRHACKMLMEAGMDDFMIQPPTLDELQDLLDLSVVRIDSMRGRIQQARRTMNSMKQEFELRMNELFWDHLPELVE